MTVPPSDGSTALREQFGDIDIYLFDQLLRGRFDDRPRVLDAGCGGGRNLPYFLRHGFEVFAADADSRAIDAVRRLSASLNRQLPADHVHCGPLERMPWPAASMDAVICSAVMHFAADATQWEMWLKEMWRVLAPRGLFFARLATSIGLEDRLPATVGRVRLPDGSDRFVVDEATLLHWTTALNARLVDPIKTTNVQNSRCMTTWVLMKQP
jgi:SAM-dependent methyltransferase